MSWLGIILVAFLISIIAREDENSQENKDQEYREYEEKWHKGLLP